MSQIELLEKRRQLVELSADLQRATIARRLDSIEQRPRLAALGTLAALGARPGVRKALFATAIMAFRAWRRHRSH
jgi:hypothetical protein